MQLLGLLVLATVSCDRTEKELAGPVREVKLSGPWDSYPILGISVPESFTYKRGDGVDFVEHHITSRSGKCSIYIYTGGNSREFVPAAAHAKKGIIGGREVTWDHESSNGDATATTSINMFLNPKPDYKGVFQLCGHRTAVSLTGRNAKDLDALKRICETLRLIRPRLVNDHSQSN